MSPRLRAIFVLLLPMIVAACAHRAPIAYPATPAGDALRHFYTAPAAEAQEASKAVTEIQDKATRQTLIPAMLAIVTQDDSVNALSIAWLLWDWEPELFRSTAPQFGHFLPALARGLRNGNHRDEPNDMTHWSAVASALFLGRMGPTAAYPIRRDMYACFNAPVDQPIEGESNDGWTRAILGLLISCYGEDGVPALVRGMGHADPGMRAIAISSLTNTGELRVPGYWHVPAAQMAVNTSAARAALPKIVERLWDANAGVRSYAAQAVGILATPQTLTPGARDRLRELFLGPDGNDIRYSQGGTWGVALAMAALHPMFTAELLGYFDTAGDPHQYAATRALRQIGPPILPEMIQRLARDPAFGATVAYPMRPSAYAIIRAMGWKAFPALQAASVKESDPATRQRAQTCLEELINTARKTVTSQLSSLDNPRPDRPDNDDIVALRIRDLQTNAPVAAPALPTLEKLAKGHPSESVRTAAKAAIEQINREKMDLP